MSGDPDEGSDDVAEKGPRDEGGETWREHGRDRAPSGSTDRVAFEEESGSTAAGPAPARGFNPAWLLVPAAGLLLGGVGIAAMNSDQSVGSRPTVTVTAPSATVVRPVAPVGTSTTAPGCDLDFRGTEVRPPVERLQEGDTGRYQQAPPGRAFVVVDTVLTNSGTTDCYATPGYQRVHTSGNTYYTGNGEVGSLLPGGDAVQEAVPAGRSVKGAYAFQVPTGSTVSSVRLRSNGSDQWTVVDAG